MGQDVGDATMCSTQPLQLEIILCRDLHRAFMAEKSKHGVILYSSVSTFLQRWNEGNDNCYPEAWPNSL